jgi:hypothetical protein
MAFETLTAQQLDAMDSATYRSHMEGPDSAAFIKRAAGLAATPVTRTMRTGESAPAPTPEQSFPNDPSWDGENDGPSTPAQKADAPAQPAAAAQPTTEPTLAIWRYQPRDSQGRNLGGEQVFKYDPTLPVDDPKSLASQLTKAHTMATIALRTKKVEQAIAELKPSDKRFEEPRLLAESEHPNAKALNELSEQALSSAVQAALSAFQQKCPDYKPSIGIGAAVTHRPPSRPGEFRPQAAHRAGRESLDSSGSCHP